MDTDDSLLTIATFATLPELNIARGLLESEGIDCLAPEEHHAAVKGALLGGSPYAWLRLQVRASDAERAKALLESVTEEDHLREEDEKE